MAVPPSNPNPNPNASTTPAPFTSVHLQVLRQILQVLHSTAPTTPNGPRPSMPLPTRPAAAAATATATPTPVSCKPLPFHQQTITIDASTRVTGHGNQVAVASLSSTEQQVAMIKEFFGGVLQTPGDNRENATADMTTNVNLNVVIHAGVNLIGSRNVVAFNGNGNGNKREVCHKDYADHSSTNNKNNKNNNDISKFQDAPLPKPHSAAERKRRAESEPAVPHHQTTPSQKKSKVEE